MPLSTIYQLWQSVILVEETDVSAENYRHFIGRRRGRLIHTKRSWKLELGWVGWEGT
jgi:hypothetical protein